MLTIQKEINNDSDTAMEVNKNVYLQENIFPFITTQHNYMVYCISLE